MIIGTGLHQLNPFPGPVPPWSEVMGPVVVRGNDNAIATAFNLHDSDVTIHLQSGVLASRPTFGHAGAVYIASDTLIPYFDTGSAWAALVAGGGTFGTLTFGTHLAGGSFNGSANVTIATDATSNNTINTIVARDGSGNFSAGAPTFAGLVTANAGIKVSGGSIAVNQLSTDATFGLQLTGSAGATSDLVLFDHLGTAALQVRTTGVVVNTLTATTLAGTLSTAAQPNVTSVGTLTGLTVSGGNTSLNGVLTINNSTGLTQITGNDQAFSRLQIRNSTANQTWALIAGRDGVANTSFQLKEMIGGAIAYTVDNASAITFPGVVTINGAVFTVNNTVAAGVADVFAHSTGGTGDIARLRLQTSTAHWYTQTIQGVGAYAIGVVGTGDWLSITTAGVATFGGQVASGGSFRLNASNGVAILQNGYTSNESGISAQNAAGNADASFYIGGFSTARYALFSATKALFTGAIGVGNSASATVGVGLLARKMEVFDASGSSLGFVPIYATIT